MSLETIKHALRFLGYREEAIEKIIYKALLEIEQNTPETSHAVDGNGTNSVLRESKQDVSVSAPSGGQDLQDDLWFELMKLIKHRDAMPQTRFSPKEFRDWSNEKDVALNQFWSFVVNPKSPIRASLKITKEILEKLSPQKSCCCGSSKFSLGRENLTTGLFYYECMDCGKKS